MKKAKLTFFPGILFLLLSGFLFAQSDDVKESLQIEVPQHIKTLKEQIRIAENNDDWDSYYRLRAEMIEAWRHTNADVAGLYRTVTSGTPDLTPDGAPAGTRGNVEDKSFIREYEESSSYTSSGAGGEITVFNGWVNDISMDISRTGEIYIAVSGRLDGTTTRDSIYIYKSDNGGETWTLWNSLFATTQLFKKIEILCFDGQIGGSGDSYLLLFYLFENGWLRVGRTETSTPGWFFYTLTGSSGGGPVLEFAADRNNSSSNYRAICVYDSANIIKSIRSEPTSNGTVWQDVGVVGSATLVRDLDFTYGWNGAVYASYNGFNTGNLYAIENTDYADPTSWGTRVTLLNGATDTTRRSQIIASRQDDPNNIVVVVFERASDNWDLHTILKPVGGDWGTMEGWVIPEENKWVTFYSRRTTGNQVFRSAFERSGQGNTTPRSIRYKSYNGSSWTESIQISDVGNNITGLQRPEVGDVDGSTPVFAYVGSNALNVFFISLVSTNVNDNDNILPGTFSLKQNYPNPFNPSTIISWYSPVHGNISLKVYDVLGREVATLINEEKPAGTYEVTFVANALPSGVYFVKMEASSSEGENSFSETKKMVLIK